MNEIPICQSCGMPMENNEMKGTNIDGSRSDDYCVYCFANGIFTKEMTMDEMISLNIQYLDVWIDSTGVEMTEKEAIEQLRLFLLTLKKWKC
ncbi:MAG: zinc ribbon domain-containing protein [Methanomassiliicoccaceae archaeon]|nr:zinc ribbon domain-containing protein [Methanomassiliicoccaceae archaeon]